MAKSCWSHAVLYASLAAALAGLSLIHISLCIRDIVNSGMVSGLLPVVGLPLPLFSYGGTSLVTIMAGFGMLMSVHAHRRTLRR